MSEPIKNIKNEAWIIDTEYVPCLRTGRRVLGLAESVTDEEVLTAMYKEAGATEENPEPMLKSVMYRIVSIAALVRKVNGSISLNLFSRPVDDNFDEKAIIEGFLTGIGNRLPQIVGFASATFDLTTIFQRAVINGINAREFCIRPAKPWDNEPDYFNSRNDWNVDLLNVLGGYGKSQPKLAEIALACGIPAKVGGEGSQVAKMWREGKGREIVNYNECDVLTTYLLWLQTAYTCGLLTAEDVEAEKAMLNALLTQGRQEKPHLGEFQDLWIALNETNSPAPQQETLSRAERAKLELECGDALMAYAIGDEGFVKELLGNRGLSEVSAAELRTLIDDPASGRPKVTVAPVVETNASPAPLAANRSTARNIGDMVTAKQLGMIRAISREAKIDGNSECQSVMGCNVDELSKRAASDFIEHLQNLQRNAVAAAA